AEEEVWSLTIECNYRCPQESKSNDTIFVDNYIKDFSVDKVGVLNQLLENAAKEQQTLKFGHNTYYISKDLVVNGNLTIVGVNNRQTTIKPLQKHSGTALITAKGKLSISNVIIDGANIVTYGLNSYNDLIVTNCVFRNIMGN